MDTTEIQREAQALGDSKPLRYQFQAEHGGAFTWDYVESGPKVRRVLIGQIANVEVEASISAHLA